MSDVNTIRAANKHTRKFLLLGLVFGAMALASAGVQAATFTVNRTTDTRDSSPGDGVCRDTGATPKCSLRAAIEEANKLSGVDWIELSETGYSLTLGTLEITDSVEIHGVSQGSTRIVGNKQFRVLKIGRGENDFPFTYFSDLTITNGKAGTMDPGGGVDVASGQFVGDRVVITGNETTVQGGGVAVGRGEFICIDCTISWNTTGNLNFTGGQTSSGGGLYIYSTGGAWLYRTTISNNTAVRGGGIAGGGYLEMREGTISDNTAKAGGGGIKTMDPSANWWIGFGTITNNKLSNTLSPADINEAALGGGVFHTAGSLKIGRTIIAGNIDPWRVYSSANFSPDCATTSTTKSASGDRYEVNQALISYWDNIYGNVGNLCKAVNATDGGDVVQPNDLWGYGASTLDVKLDPYLGANGGYVATRKLLPGSIAINAAQRGNPTDWWLFRCYGLDATHTTRPQGAYCDAGSYEAR